MGQAADRFGEHLAEGPDAAARASRELAVALEEERGRLGAVRPGRADIAEAHARMLGAVDELAGAMRFLGDALAARDETRREPARTRLRGAMERWRVGVEAVRRVCP